MFSILLSCCHAQNFTVATWNLESGDSDSELIAFQLATFEPVDIWGLTEVAGVFDSILFETGVELSSSSDYINILGTTGRSDKLQILFDSSKFELIDSYELDHINIDNTVRAPLVAHLLERSIGIEFLFMVNHLARGKADKRLAQSRLLNTWAQDQELPLIAVGDFNYDWSVTNGDVNHDAGYDALTENDVFEWVRPDELIRTQCSATGSGCRYNSVLDFVFVSKRGPQWLSKSFIHVENGDFPDNSRTSDHRVVLAEFTIGLVK